MEDERKTPVAPFLATVVFAAALAYPLSIGPVCWWIAKEASGWDGCVGTRPPKVAPHVYWPLGWLAAHGPRPVHDALYWYAAPRDGGVLIPSEI